MKTPLLALAWLHCLWPGVDASVFRVANPNVTSALNPKVRPRDDDPSDFGWVKRWAAVGDSFTAGIGSGSPIGNPLTESPYQNDWYCARYDTSYPMIMNDALGSSVEDFQFLACSGDRTGGIYKQIEELEGELDLVVMTAGGNDLCLDACTDVISIAQNNLDKILKGNLELLLDALEDKMNDDSVVVFNGYAQFFNTENEDCADNQDWTLFNLLNKDALKLTVKRRKTFNDLVVQINDIIKEVVDDAKDKYKYKIGFSNWDLWPREGVDGQFCDPASTGEYPDPDQPELQFFKPDTRIDLTGELRKRDGTLERMYSNETLWNIERENRDRSARVKRNIYNSLLMHSPNPQAEARHLLQNRADKPSRANCPDDEDVDIQPASIGLPNSIAKNFHPNELGHYTIASWALQTVIDLRAEVLDVPPPSCEPVDKFTCWQDTDWKGYANEPFLNDQYEDFCDDVETGDEFDGWTYDDTFAEDTPDETQFKVTLEKDGAGSAEYSKAECKDSMSRIINGCDGNDPDNPMDWKFGGEWKRGRFTYQVNPQRENRPWPPPKETSGNCKGWYHGVWSSYVIKGQGWATNDWGQDTLEPAASDCIGGGLTLWRFKYFDEPDEDGMEWQADFNTPIWVRSRCFKNNKAVKEAGGYTDGCGGND
ncbi:SGNH hydrolase-type esterase domain-containing protein [Dichotomopilus funicola]|uniref:SGNH hydrolase-type esterase domain-containing protein n=1 Tax=Dichotomopilus funicola TaxID=1934379 RepID=A0AAN6V1K6_9PEZI|nr:SGNH hydrolase-type esterase domain-containing protein [Dichotomopilus funicola]